MVESVHLNLEDAALARAVYGHRDENLRLIEHELVVDIHVRGQDVTVSGDPVDIATASRTILGLYDLARRGLALQPSDVVRAAEMLRTSPGVQLEQIFLDSVLTGTGNRSITPKTLAQKHYVDTMRKADVVFGVGPAGTGKTYLAMALGIAALLRRDVKRIVLTRPAVEAGERLGFLPGDLQEKVSPYLRPLYDALHDMLGFDKAQQLVERGVIEIAPLAFMRGRTLNGSFVILDEAQNTTREQMRMFLTRLGYDSSAVITGDVTQIDLENKHKSGLEHAVRILEGVDGIAVCRFTEVDVVRHPLVKRIIGAYEADDAANAARRRDVEHNPWDAVRETESAS